jgi:subtilisin family serine protease
VQGHPATRLDTVGPRYLEEPMRSITRLGLTLLLALPLLSSTITTPASSSVPPRTTDGRSTKLPWQAGGVRFVPNEVVVVLKASASRAAVRALDARVGVDRVTEASGFGVDVVRVAHGTSVDAAIRRFERSPLVRFAEPNRIATVEALPDDTHFSDQWALNNTGQLHEVTNQGGGTGTTRHGTSDADVDAPEAWAAQTVDDPVVVAVIDTGVDVDHPDLANSMWVNTAEQAGTIGVDDDGNGFVDDVNGWDFLEHDADPSPTTVGGPRVKLENAHGTHVAGIVAAEQNNTEGVSGVCPDCSIMALRIGDAASLTLGREVQAINYAIDNGADIINLSIASPVWSKTERAAIKQAGQAGILVVIAAGNSSLDNDISFDHANNNGVLDAWAPSFPASYTLSNILAVAASNDRDVYGLTSQCGSVGLKLWQCAFTSWGHDSVDVAAPGVDIKSSVTVGVSDGADPDYAVFDGTSMASPMAAGVAGVVLAENPGYGPAQVKNAIMNSVEHPGLPLYTSWADVTHVPKTAIGGKFTRTQGRVNAFRALTGSTANATPKTDGNINGATGIVKSRLGHVAWPADANDVYKKRLAKGVRYTVVLNGPGGSDMDLWVWNPGTTEIFQFTAGCFSLGGTCPAIRAVSAGKTADEKVAFTAKKAGVYYFQVNGWYKGGNYKLTVKRV